MSTNVAYLRSSESDTLVEDQDLMSVRPSAAKAVSEFLDNEESVNPELLELVQRIFLVRAEEAPRAVAFAAIDGNGDSGRICALVAHLLSKASRGTVCIVDANVRGPSVHTLLGACCQGPTEALASSAPIRSFTIPLSARLSLVPAGAIRGESEDLLSLDRMQTRIKELRSQFDWVIVNAPPLNRYVDSLALGQLTDGLVLIIEAGSTRRESAQVAVSSVRSSNIPILGAVLNNRTFPIPDKLYALL
jgi:Mrp family chromosome partitioning ATPase